MKNWTTMLVLGAAVWANSAAAQSSTYTALDEKSCTVTNRSAEDFPDWTIEKCKGVAGYNLELNSGDDRTDVTVLHPSGKRSDLQFISRVSSGFSSIGDKAEWRMKNNKPYALIVRYIVAEIQEDGTHKTVQYLTVSKIAANAACLVAKITPADNVKARAVADSAAKRECLK